MKKIAALLILLAALWSAPQAQAACAGGTCYAIAVGPWGTNGTWSVTPGGASCACTPATGDNLVWDASSPAGSYTASAITIGSLDASTSSGITIGGTAAVTVNGPTFNIPATATHSNTGTYTFTASAGTTTITLGGSNTIRSVTINAPGGVVQLGSALTQGSTANQLNLTAGTFNANNFAWTVGAFTSSNSNTRTLTMGSGLLTISGATSVWNTATTTGLTFNKDTANIALTGTTGNKNFTAGGLTFNDISMVAQSGSSGVQFGSAATIGTLALTAPYNLLFSASAIVTASAITGLASTSANPASITSTSPNISATLSIASGTYTFDWVAVKDMTFTGGATFVANNSLNLRNNSGITINAPSGGGGSTGGFIIGGWLLNRDLGAANDNRPVYLNLAA